LHILVTDDKMIVTKIQLDGYIFSLTFIHIQRLNEGNIQNNCWWRV